MDAYASACAPDAAVIDRRDLVAAIRHAQRAGDAREISDALALWSHRRAACVRSGHEFDNLAADLRRLGAPRALIDDIRAYRPPTGYRAALPLAIGMLATGAASGIGAAVVTATALPAPLVIVGAATYIVALALLVLVLSSRRAHVRAAVPRLQTAEAQLYTIVNDTIGWSEPPPVLDRGVLQRARPRERRAGARRAAGERAGTDPGDGDPEPPSPSVGGAR